MASRREGQNREPAASGISPDMEMLTMAIAQSVATVVKELMPRNEPTFKPRAPTVTVPTFTADAGQDVTQWLEEFERAARFLNWSESNRLMAVEMYLSGTAA